MVTIVEKQRDTQGGSYASATAATVRGFMCLTTPLRHCKFSLTYG